MPYIRCIECHKLGHVKCTKEEMSWKIKISAKVLSDLNEFVHQKFTEAEASDSSHDEDVDAFDYIKSSKTKKGSKSKKKKKLTKTQKKIRTQFMNDSSNIMMPSSDDSSSEQY